MKISIWTLFFVDHGDLAVVNAQARDVFDLDIAVENVFAERKWSSRSQYCVCTLYCLFTYIIK